MIGIWVTGLFVGGLLVGSFLNVVILRYDPEGSLFSFGRLGGRSRCRKCGQELGFLELVPVFSFLFLKGKCRNCKDSISIQYPIVELLSGIIFVAIPLFLNKFYGVFNVAFFEGASEMWYYFLVLSWIAAFLTWLVMGVIDLREYIIPDEVVIGIGFLGIVVGMLTGLNAEAIPAFRGSFLTHFSLLFPAITNIFLNRLVAVALAGVIFYSMYALSRGRAMGFGDVKLALVSGLLFGWPDILLVVILSFVLGGMFGLISIIRRKKTMKDMLPFAPFFVGGCALVFFFGQSIVELYFKIFSFTP